MTTDARPGAIRGPVRRAERALAPDLARGAMLLLIALANAVGVILGGQQAQAPSASSAANGFNFLMNTLVNARAYPVFAVMFGYGIWQLYRRQQTAGTAETAARSVLLRRNAWLVAFGFAHATLLYFGDFLGAYGLVGIVVTLLLLRRSDKFHRLVLWLWAFAAAEILVLGGLSVHAMLTSRGGSAGVPNPPVPSFIAPDYGTSMLDRLAEWPVHTATVLPFIMIVWLGVWAARRRVLEEPERHQKLLRRTAIIGLGIGFLGGLPTALLSAGLLHVDTSTASLFTFLHGGSGMFAGLGYAAVFGLLAMRFAGRTGPVVGALSALGRRSLSGYLCQSVAWLVLLLPFSLHVSTWFGNPTLTAAALAVLVWLGTVLAADRLDRLGRSGPAELLLRRLTYGPR